MEAFTLKTPAGDIQVARWQPVEATPAGSPIVLLHDSLGCIALWRDFPALLAEASGREVIAYDRLGFGHSTPYPGTLPPSFVADEARILPCGHVPHRECPEVLATIVAEFLADRD